jgi:apolipoprotein D and lipocalin family protein
MARKILAYVFGAATILTGCTGVPEGLEPITGFEPERYLGQWYEIARLDHTFERNLIDVSATYTQGEKGDIRVQNRGFNTKSGEWKQIDGHARFIAGDTVGSLKVSFFGPFYGGYHIIALDRKNYSYAMVAGPSRSYLWILARDKTLDDNVYAELVSKAHAWGFNTEQLIKVEHRRPDD